MVILFLMLAALELVKNLDGSLFYIIATSGQNSIIRLQENMYLTQTLKFQNFLLKFKSFSCV